MVKIGAVTLDVSHPMNFAWALGQIGRGKYTAIFNDGFRGDDEVTSFANKNGLKICKTLDELADEVDIGFIHSCNWDKHIDYLTPFIKRGKPVFIDKPIVGNMADVRKIEKLIEDGAKIIGTSAARYCYEVDAIKEKLAELNTKPVHSVVTVGGDGFNYEIHAVEEVLGIHSANPVSCTYIKSGELETLKCDNYLIKFDDNTTAQCLCFEGKGVLFNTMVVTESRQGGSDFCVSVDNAKLYLSLMDKVCDYVEGKANVFAKGKQLTDGIRILLAGKVSKENGGKEILLDSAELDNVSFDGYAYEDAYSKKAKKIYL